MDKVIILECQIQYWQSRQSHAFRSTFDSEHYIKVIQAKVDACNSTINKEHKKT